METIAIHTDFIRLQELLKYAGAVDTGGEAKIMIRDGFVTVNGEICTMRGKKLRPGDQARFRGKIYTVAASDTADTNSGGTNTLSDGKTADRTDSGGTDTLSGGMPNG